MTHSQNTMQQCAESNVQLVISTAQLQFITGQDEWYDILYKTSVEGRQKCRVKITSETKHDSMPS